MDIVLMRESDNGQIKLGQNLQWRVGLCPRHYDICWVYCKKIGGENHQLRIYENPVIRSVWYWWPLWDVRASFDWILECLTLLELKLEISDIKLVRSKLYPGLTVFWPADTVTETFSASKRIVFVSCLPLHSSPPNSVPEAGSVRSEEDKGRTEDKEFYWNKP